MISAKINSYDYRIICLVFACLIYAIFGSPTPNNIGVAEIIIGALLLLSIGIGRACDIFLRSYKLRFWEKAGHIFLIYGLSIPLLVAVISGNDLPSMIRDVIPFMFLFLPLFLIPTLRERPYYFKMLLLAILIIGGLFALRSLMIRFYGGSGELLYLENMPTVLFACLLMIGGGVSFIMRGLTVKNIAVFVVLITISLIPIAAMVITLQRASLGAVVLYIAILQVYFLYKSPERGAVLLVICAAAIAIISISFSSLFLSLWSKTQSVGLNMRVQEFAAVWDIVSSNPMTFLFGIGWGGVFYSPAVGGLSVNFTHNFFTFLLLKTGAIGVFFSIAYIAGLLERLLRVILKNPVFGLALAAPILIDLTFYASFKSLDFGLVLLMISSSLVYFRDYIDE